MKLARIVTTLAAVALSIGSVMAVPPGKSVEFATSRGKATFDGKVHADKGLKCADCHNQPKLFEMKKSAGKTSMAAMNEGKSCGACHDGKKAFSVKDPAACAKCHAAVGAAAGKPAASAPKSETPGEYIDDTAITVKVKSAIFEEPSLKSAEINVETSKGVVQLSGFVRSRADIAKAAEVARRVPGVKSVKNDMILKGTQ